MLHLTNGGSAVAVLQHAGIEGDLLAWNDVLHEGPVRGDLPLTERRAERAAFIASQGWADDARQVEADFRARDERLARALDTGEPLALWFEHDLYDQWQLVEVLTRVAAIAGAGAEAELVLASDYIGHFRPAAVHLAWDARTRCTPLHLDAALRAWDALTRADPRGLNALRAADTTALPHLHAALTRHAEEFPAVTTGLSRSERQLLEALEPGPRPLRELFAAAHHAREAAHFLGDTAFLSLVARLASAHTPLVRAVARATDDARRDSWSRALELTNAGVRALAGEFDHARTNRVSRWLGGTELGGNTVDWRWDDVEQSIVRR